MYIVTEQFRAELYVSSQRESGGSSGSTSLQESPNSVSGLELYKMRKGKMGIVLTLAAIITVAVLLTQPPAPVVSDQEIPKPIPNPDDKKEVLPPANVPNTPDNIYSLDNWGCHHQCCFCRYLSGLVFCLPHEGAF